LLFHLPKLVAVMWRSVFAVSTLSWLHAIDMCCNAEDDEMTLLQLNTRTTSSHWPAKKHVDAQSLLKSVKHMAREMSSESPEVVNVAIDAVTAALAEMTPLLEGEHANDVNQVQHQLEEIQACHSSDSHGQDVVGDLAAELAVIEQCRADLAAAGDNRDVVCTAWTNHADLLSFPPCLLAGSDAEQVYSIAQGLRNWVNDAWPVMDSMRTKCNEATLAANSVYERCHSVIDGYADKFCQHLLSCSLLSSCHHHEVEVYDALRTNIQATMLSRQDQYRSIKQAECICDLIKESVGGNATIDDSTLNTCDDNIDVSHLVVSFPDPEHVPVCPASGQAGNPQCPEIQLPEAWTNGAPTAPEDGCYPLLTDYQLSNLQNSPSAPPLNTGTFSSIKAVWKSGRIMCDRNRNSQYKWQTCCSGGYTSGCGASFELIHNGVNAIQQGNWHTSASQCEQPTAATGDIICNQAITVASSDNLIVTWYETRLQTSLGDNEVDLTVDLYGCK